MSAPLDSPRARALVPGWPRAALLSLSDKAGAAEFARTQERYLEAIRRLSGPQR